MTLYFVGQRSAGISNRVNQSILLRLAEYRPRILPSVSSTKSFSNEWYTRTGAEISLHFSMLTVIRPLEWDILSHQEMKWMGNFGIPLNKSLIVRTETEELTKLLQVIWCRKLGYSLNKFRVRMETRCCDQLMNLLNALTDKVAFLEF